MARKKNKRNKTPPPSDDEPRFLTVVYPYPLNANMELDSDRKSMILWLACCTGKDPLAALYHKPRSPNMVIIEVNRDFTGWDKLLGQHKWIEVLKNPSDEEKERHSSIFYCTMNSVRDVSKTGWKRVVVEEHWFINWTPQNKIVVHPYPPTSACPTPIEDQTNAPLCRPLPVAIFPRLPSPDRAPPVGSKEWLSMKDAGFTPVPSKNTGVKGSTPTTRIASPLIAPNAWKRGSPLTPAGTVTPRNLQVGVTSGIPLNVSYASGSSISSDWPGTPNLMSPTLDSISSSESQSIATPADDDASTVYIGSEFEQAMSNIGFEDEFEEEGQDDVWDAPALAVVAEATVPEEPAINYWEDYGKQGPQEKNDDDLCPSHGKLCSRGICSDYADKQRKLKRADMDRKRREERVKKEAQRAKNKKDKKVEVEAEPPGSRFSYTALKQKPSHLAEDDEQKASGPSTTTVTEMKNESSEAPSTSGPAPEKPPSAPPPSGPSRPARGRKMNAANQNKQNALPITSPPAQDDQKSASGAPGWKSIPKGPWGAPSTAPSVAGNGWNVPKGPWDASTQASSVVNGDTGGKRPVPVPSAAVSSNGGWGKLQKSPWDASSQASSDAVGRGRAPSVAVSSNGGWGKLQKSPWDAQSSVGSDAGGAAWEIAGGGGKGKKNKSKASSVVSSNGGWGRISKAPWDPPSTRAPSIADPDDDAKTVNGDYGDWDGGRDNAIKRSWADEVEENGGF